MYRKFSKLIFIMIGVSLVFLLSWCAENEPLAPDAAEEAIETMLTAGPEEGATLAFNAAVTFTWDATISPGHILNFTYTYIRAGVDTVTVTDMQKTFSRTGLTTGSYQFSVFATGVADEDTSVDASPVVRNFSVGAADADVPVVTILQGPKSNSYAATGSNFSFEWTATDPSTGGGIVSYEYALADSSDDVDSLTWSTPTLFTTQKSFFNQSDGTWRFWVRATDVSGATGTASTDFVVKPADILFAIEPGLTDTDVEYWHTNVLKDFAYEDFYVSDAASFIDKLNSGQYSSLVWTFGSARNYAFSALADSANWVDVTAAGTAAEAVYNYEQGGGHVWIAAAELLYQLDAYNTVDWQTVVIDTDTTYITGPNTFARNVLHLEDFVHDYNFQGANSTGVSTYPDFIVDGMATMVWCDALIPTTDAEAIYTFSTGDGIGETCAIRYPTTGETKVVFCAFYLTDSAHLAACKTEDIYDMATTIFTDFGENND
jgi:hypothetical protein